MRWNVLIMFGIVSILAVAGWLAASMGVSVELVLGIFAGVSGIAGMATRELLAPSRSDVQILLDHEREMAELIGDKAE